MQNLGRETYKHFRETVIDMILATEMTKHFEHLAKFMNVCSARIVDNQQIDVMPDLHLHFLYSP